MFLERGPACGATGIGGVLENCSLGWRPSLGCGWAGEVPPSSPMACTGDKKEPPAVNRRLYPETQAMGTGSIGIPSRIKS